MAKHKKIPGNELGISREQMESIARVLLPFLKQYLASDEGRRDYDEWKKAKEKFEAAPNKEDSEKSNRA